MVEEDYRHKSLLHFPFIISVWHTLYVYIYVKNLYFCVRFMLCRYEKVHMSSWQGGFGLHRPAYFPCTPIKHRPHSVEHIFQLLCSGGTFYWKSPELDWKVNIEPTETSKMCDGCLRPVTFLEQAPNTSTYTILLSRELKNKKLQRKERILKSAFECRIRMILPWCSTGLTKAFVLCSLLVS